VDELKGRNAPVDVDTVEVVEKPVKQRAVRVQQITLDDGRVGWEYSDGSVRNDSGHMLAPLPGVQPITNETARSMVARRRAIATRAQLEGLVEAIGIDPSEIDEELIVQAGSAVKVLTKHMAVKFQSSNSLRDMAVAYPILTTPAIGDKKESPGDNAADSTRDMLRDLADIARAFMASKSE
jgi:hypothetical protein